MNSWSIATTIDSTIQREIEAVQLETAARQLETQTFPVARSLLPESPGLLAYLVIRDGTKWSDVFRLVPGRTVTIGRASTNHIVIKEDQASRQHAELFFSEGNWVVRDLQSRNGTVLGKEKVEGDKQLAAGDIIRIASTQLAFVHDLSKAYSSPNAPVVRNADKGEETVVGFEVSRSGDPMSATSEIVEPTTITHRRGQTRFLQDSNDAETSIPKIGRAATKLCRLGFEMANQTDVVKVANLALNGLLDETRVDAGAILAFPRTKRTSANPSDLKILASRSDLKPSYQRISDFLAETVLREGEAVLARNIEGDSALGIRDSKGEIQATSVICAPIKQDEQITGLVHLYSTDASQVLDPDDLEFTLAVAANIALATKTLARQQALVADLSKSQTEIHQLREQLGVESEIVGSSDAMVDVHHQIARAAPSKATVLIRGESGVGKELVARAVHFSSARKKGPFVCLNCAALSETLLESELFGHERGAFTGATDRKSGKFESADKGTLMLDEIGEMSQSIQAKFLRVLEGHPFERVGGSKPITANVRVIAATNRDLERDVKDGQFRKDLYFRLHVLEIQVPPLRKRPQDIVELAEYFLQKFNAETGRKVRTFSPQAIQMMREYRWPGNVRELRNVVERAVVHARSDFIEPQDLVLSSISTASESLEMHASREIYRPISLAEMERQHIAATLDAQDWNKSRTAAVLGIERSTLDRKIRKYEIRR